MQFLQQISFLKALLIEENYTLYSDADNCQIKTVIRAEYSGLVGDMSCPQCWSEFQAEMKRKYYNGSQRHWMSECGLI